MLKQSKIWAIGMLMGASALFADSTDYQQTNTKETAKVDTYLYSGGFVVGAGLTTVNGTWHNTATALQLGYYGTCMMFDIGINVTAAKKFDPFVTFVLGHLGGRWRICENLFTTLGVMGSGSIASEHDNTKQWSTGGFMGLDYQFSKHFMLSGKVYPYNYERRGPKNNIFANGTLSLFYVF